MRALASPAGEWASSILISPVRARSQEARPEEPRTLTLRELSTFQATRDTENVPTAPEAKVAVKVATSSFSTRS